MLIKGIIWVRGKVEGVYRSSTLSLQLFCKVKTGGKIKPTNLKTCVVISAGLYTLFNNHSFLSAVQQNQFLQSFNI